jgi:hypothetical protein
MFSNLLRAQVLIDTQFGESNEPVRVDLENAKTRITGVLHSAWSDNSAWADVTVDYQNQIEEGRAFTRVDAKAIRTGRVQLAHGMGVNEQASLYVISMEARSPDSQSIDVGVRQSGPPYEFLWQRRIALGGRWQTFDFALELPARSEPISMFIVQTSAGRFDIRSFKLERVTREALAARMAEKGAVAGKNLVRVSRFPLGLPTGWSLNREASDELVKIEAATSSAIENGRAMRIASAEPFTLQSAPIELINPFVKHTMSVYARGQGEFDFRVRSDGQENAAINNLKLNDQWQRVELPFEPRVGARWPVLEVEGQGTVELDAMQCELGERASAFNTIKPVEVTISAGSATRLFLPDDSITLTIATTGKLSPGSIVEYQVFDYTNSVLNQGQLPATDSIVLPSKVVPGIFGSFRIEVVVKDGDSVVSNFDEVVIHKVPKPRFAGRDAPESHFGVHVEGAQRHLQMAKAIGVNWVRLHDAGIKYTGWMYAEPEPGKWTFFDRELDRYRANHLMILGTLTTAPNWASYFDKRRNDYFDQFYRPRDMKQFENYVRTIVTRHKDRIDYWDVWNEPWITSWWSVGYDESKPAGAGYVTSKEPQKDYVAMCRLVNDVVKSIDPQAKVAGVNSTSHSPGGDNMMAGDLWTKGIVEHGGHELADFMTFHTYVDGKQLFPGDAVERGLTTAFGHVPESARTKPKWMTEGSAIHSSIGQGLYRHTTPGQTGENVAHTSDALVRFVVSHLSQGVDKVFLYSMHSANGFGHRGDWRVFVCDDLSLHPSAVAFANMASLLDGKSFARMIEVEDFYVYLFETPTTAVGVVSSKPGVRGMIKVGGDGKQLDLVGNTVLSDGVNSEHVFYLVGTTKQVLSMAQSLKSPGN